MYKLPTAIITAATLCLLLTSSVALAGEVLIIDENLDVLPLGYQLQTSASTNATADFQIGNLGASNGLIFDGSWDVPANGSEFSVGAMVPILLTPADFQLDPGDIDGITSVHWTLDVEVISTTMTPPEQGIFVQLIVFQEQSNGGVLTFADSGNFVVTGQSASLDITLIESDFGLPGARPDFSATGRPISFALQIGATYPKTTNPDAFFVDGRMTGDNWTVAVTGGGEIFSDSFESGPVLSRSAELADEDSCLCPAPAPPPSSINE